MWMRHWRVAVAVLTGPLDSLLAGHPADQEVLDLGFAGRILPTIRETKGLFQSAPIRPSGGWAGFDSAQ